LELSFLGDAIAFHGEGLGDQRAGRGGEPFCGDGGGDVECADVGGGRIVVLDTVEDCGEGNAKMWWTT
jgi:hypothetical protein